MKAKEWKRHKKGWSHCEGCYLCNERKNVVLYKGKLPCDVLFVGEAPGASEDIIGKPFVGPAGKLLDHMIKQSLATPVRVGFTNLIACIPLEDGRKVSEPPKEAINACSPRLEDILSISSPTMIVAVGKLAEKNLECDVTITHPAAILRANVTQQLLLIQTAIITLKDAWEDIYEDK